MLSLDIRKHIIKPALQITDLWSESSEILVYGTGLIETGYNHLMQIGEPLNGGIGFWQTEPSDYKDIIKWLRYPANKILTNSLISACYYTMLPLDASVLAQNLRYAALMCRVHYLRAPQPLPDPKSIQGFSDYYKTHYNTLDGKADIHRCCEIFKGIIDGHL